MSALREAAQQALTILEAWKHKGMWGDWDGVTDALRAALVEEALQKFTDVSQEIEAALAEPVEPVAWMVYTLDGKSVCVTDNPADFTDEHRVLPLYTAPPQRKPLTAEEIDQIAIKCLDSPMFSGWNRNLARAIERAHGIKDA